ncbi:MAG TPA: PKD domain-containing protein [Gemmatimonadaceae bacterium]|nr:PKD domain-containing protein [Gemmatimonadaceae bacterium]
MRTTTLVVAFTALVLAACDQPVAPVTRTLRAPGGKAAASISPSGDALAFRWCYTDWYNDGILQCDLVVRTAAGVSGIGSENTSDVDADWHSWSPDGASIAFVQGGAGFGEIAVMRVADGSITTLTNDAALENSPDWSPDGTRIAFLRYDDVTGSPDIYLMNASDGGNVTRLTNGVVVQGGPSWSPDGGRIAFTCADDAGTADVCAINADGTGLVHLTSGAQNDVNPDFSPDGSQIAFVRDGELRYLTLANGAVTAPAIAVHIFPSSKPSWSPGGDRIAYSVPITGAVSADRYYDAHVDVVNVDGSGSTTLHEGSGPGWRPNSLATVDAPPVAEFSASCNSLQCSFHSSSTDDGGIVSYHWTFGDGEYADYAEPGYHYHASGTYQVTLVVGDWKGQTSSVTHSVTVVAASNPPTASFTAACAGRSCTFDSNASSDDGGIVWRIWSFGDGGSAVNTVSPSHSYTADGSYTVTLSITDGDGQTTNISHDVSVVASKPPTASFTSSCAGRSCGFDGNGSSDDLGIVSRTWTFGDGSSAANVVAPNHSYAANGTYSVSLTVTDGEGHTASVSHNVTVVDAPPVARFTYSCDNKASCTFDGRSSSDDVGIASYWWQFGIGTASGSVASISFRHNSTQTVTLTVMDGAGQVASASQTIKVK